MSDKLRPIPGDVCGLGFKVTDSKAYDFEAIEAAVMETDRGRWFLAELARRHRSADTEALLAAIGKLESAIGEHLPSAGNEALAREVSAMAEALRATEADMRRVSSERLADGGAVPEGTTAFEDVGARAKNLAAGLNATTEALRSASDELKRDPTTAGRIAGLDADLSRLVEHNVTQDMLSRRITKAMDLISRLQDRIHASLATGHEPRGEASEASPAPDEALTGDETPEAGETLSAGEISYFDADRELFAAPETAPATAPELAADDPENAPHLAGMLEDALASMQLGGDTQPAAAEADEAPQTETAAAAPAEPEVEPAQTPAAELPSAAPSAPAADEPPVENEAPASRRVVIVREPCAAPPPSLTGDEGGAAAPCGPTAPELAQVPAAEAHEAPVEADLDAIVFAQPEAPAASAPETPTAAKPEAPAAAEAEQTAPASAPEEEGPEAIMKMFAEAAAKHGMQPVADGQGEAGAEPGGRQAEAAPEDTQPGPLAPETGAEAAPLEPMTPGPEERRRIVVIRRGSSADTSIPLEDQDADGGEAKA